MNKNSLLMILVAILCCIAAVLGAIFYDSYNNNIKLQTEKIIPNIGASIVSKHMDNYRMPERNHTLSNIDTIVVRVEFLEKGE